jgi:hypothetical protein
MGAFVHDRATVVTSKANVIPDGSSVTFNLFSNGSCSGSPSSTDTVPLSSGVTSASAESSGAGGASALGPLSVGAISYNAVFNSGDSSLSNSASACEPLNVESSISQFFYYIDADSSDPYSCTSQSLVNNVCTSGNEATVTVGTTHGYQVNVQVSNNTGLPITEKVQGGLASGKGVSYSGFTITPGCGTAALKSTKTGNVVIWDASGSTTSTAAGFAMAPGAMCQLQVTVTKKFASTGQQTITGQWSESQTEVSPITGKSITMTSPHTGSLAVDVTN